MPKIILVFLALLLVIIVSCSPPKVEDAATDRVVPVQVMEVVSADLPLVTELAGRLAADREVTVAAEVGGTVAGYDCDLGDRAEKDQVLIRLKPIDYELALKEAKANLAAAQAQRDGAAGTYERFRGLLSREVISKDEFDRVQTQFKSADAQLARAMAAVDISAERLSETEIKAPYACRVAARLVELGQTVAPGQPVMTLVDLDKMRVRVWVAEKEIVRIDKDDPVTISVDALEGAEFSGRIDKIGIKADERTNTFAVEILVDNPGLVLKAGLTARVRLTAQVLPAAIMIPQSAVLFRQDRREVFTAGPDDKAVLRQVKLGVTRDSLIQVVEGLSPGDRLVVTGGQYLSPGQPLKITAAPAQ